MNPVLPNSIGTEPIHILSLGAGVQSSTLALMAAAGEVTPMPKAAIFADTQAEPASVYKWLDWLEKQLPFPVLRAHRENVDPAGQVIAWGHSQIPAWKDGALGKRQCTKHWKIVPTQRACREFTGTKGKHLPDGFITLWMGISSDEIIRMKPSRESWIKHRWPLIEKEMSRAACLKWWHSRYLAGAPFAEPPKSACEFCTYKRDEQWVTTLADESSHPLLRAVEALLLPRGESLHQEGGSIFEIDLSISAQERRDERSGQGDLFGNECEGMCGV